MFASDESPNIDQKDDETMFMRRVVDHLAYGFPEVVAHLIKSEPARLSKR
jgi:hypothetical protein